MKNVFVREADIFPSRLKTGWSIADIENTLVQPELVRMPPVIAPGKVVYD